MNSTPVSPSLAARLWRFLTSLRLTLFLLLVLASLGLLGTVRRQIFDSLWFWVPLGLFGLNLTACLFRGLPEALRRSRHSLTAAEALALPERARLRWPESAANPGRLEKILQRELGRLKQAIIQEQLLYFTEWGRFRPLGPYIVHLGLLVTLLGALLGKFFGLEGRLALKEGETAQSFQVAGQEQSLPFQVRLDRFQVLFYPDGTPREFRSDLSFFLPNHRVIWGILRVNEPVTIEGLTFYQASYGHVVRLEVQDGRQSRLLEVMEGQTVVIPGTEVRLRVLEFLPDLRMPRGQEVVSLGPAVRLALFADEGHPLIFPVLKNRPELTEKQPGPYRVYLKEASFFSVFQVKRDPGVLWVYAGFLLMLAGLYLAFLRPPERWAVALEPSAQGGLEVRLLGTAPRSREGFQNRLTRLQERLRTGEQG